MSNRKFIKINRDLTKEEITNIKRFYNIDVFDENGYIQDNSRIILSICRGSFFLGSENMDYLITEKKYKILESNKTTEKFIYPITSKYIINDNDESFEFINANNETILKTIPNKKMLEIYNYFHIEFNKLHRKLMSIDLLRHKCVNTKIINGEIKKYNDLLNEFKRSLSKL